jgi:hypothetical protein
VRINVLEAGRDPMNDVDDSVPIGNGQHAARAKIVLHVDDYENVLRGDFHRFAPLPLSQMNPAMANPGSLCPDCCAGALFLLKSTQKAVFLP